MRTLLVLTEKDEFRISIPDDSKVTFGPFSPPTKESRGYGGSPRAEGTLRVHQKTKDNIVFCQSGVVGFRDLSVGYTKKIVTEEVSSIWQSDDGSYRKEVNGKTKTVWKDDPDFAVLPSGDKPKPVKKKQRARGNDQ